MNKDSRKHIGIKITDCEDVTITDPTFVGDMDGIVAERTKDLKVSGVKHIISNRIKPLVSAIKKPIASGNLKGIIAAAILSIIVGIILLQYEWTFQPNSQLESSQAQKPQPKEFQ